MASKSRAINRGHSPRRCINCSFVVPRQQKIHSTDVLSNAMLNVLSAWIEPGSVTDRSILCNECYNLIQTHSASKFIPLPKFGHLHVCYGCGISTLRAKTYRVSAECPERQIILRWTPVHQISRLERVCAACWRSANREVQRQKQHDASRPVLKEIRQLIDNIKVEFEVSEPPPLPATPTLQHTKPVLPKITSAVYKRAPATSGHCMFSECQGPERLLVPKIIREMLIIHNEFYVPPSARICRYHLVNGCWNDLTSDLCDFTGPQFDEILSILRKTEGYRLDFDNVSTMVPHLCHYWLGMNAEQFEELLSCVPSLSQEVKKPRLTLCTYIVKLRTGDSNERLSLLFQIPRSTLERIMKIARHCLMKDFVSSYLGFEHLTVEQVGNKNKIIVENDNGRMKRDFRLFRNDLNNRAATHLEEDVKIACALINKFPPVKEDPAAREYEYVAIDQTQMDDYLPE